MESMMDPLIKYVIGPVLSGIIGHFNLKTYGKVMYTRALGRVQEYYDEENFWKHALGTDYYESAERTLTEGKVVRLKGFHVTEWFPRCPGVYWTQEGQERRKRAYDFREQFRGSRYIVYKPHGKSLMVSGGLGTTRLEKHEVNNEGYRVLCATSSGICDAGIPLVVREDVYKKIQDQIQTEGAVKSDITGFYCQLPIKYEDLVVETPGEELTSRAKSFLGTTYHVPRLCIFVDSRLNITRRKSTIQLASTAWTLFKMKQSEDIIYPYSFTFQMMDPRKDYSINEAADFLQNYVHEYNGEQILTDFDERIPRIDPIYPLSTIMTSEIDQTIEQKKILEGITDLSVDVY